MAQPDTGVGRVCRGRPRTPGLERAILDAALAVLATDGLAHFSVAKVAATAGTTKATIYLRYSTRHELIEAALRSMRVADLPASCGETRVDLSTLLEHIAEQYQRFGGLSILGSCLVAAQQRPELLAILRSSVVAPHREAVLAALQRAQATHQVRRDADLEQLASTLVGTIFADHLIGRDLPPGWAPRLVDAVLGGAAGPALTTTD